MDTALVIRWIVIGMVFYVLTSLAILDVARKDFGSLGIKALWGIIAFIPFIGWLIYLVFGFRKGKKREPGRSGPEANPPPSV
ncbi:MAG: PLDc N-terminal domain-containing protein [Desulfobacterales bacterium]|nr:PLDc N-terminal domain-containing protein [Desulfobacterales bacterium]